MNNVFEDILIALSGIIAGIVGLSFMVILYGSVLYLIYLTFWKLMIFNIFRFFTGRKLKNPFKSILKRISELTIERNRIKREKKLIKEREEKERKAHLAREKYDEEKQLIKNLPSYNSDKNLKKLLNQFSYYVEYCSKCTNDEFSIKKINQTVLILECVNCNKKTTHTSNTIPDNKITRLFEQYELYKTYYKYRNYDFLKESFINLYKIDINKVSRRYHYHHQKLQIIGLKEPVFISYEKQDSRNFSSEVRKAVYERDGGKCRKCGSSHNIHYDHIIPHSKGGANTFENCQILCARCNVRKSNKIE